MPTPSLRLSRRQAILLGATAVGTLSLGAYSTLLEPFWPEIVRRPLPIANLPKHLVGLQLAQISDIHICSRIPDSYLQRQFAAVSALTPHFVAYTGDFVTWEPDIATRISKLFPQLPTGSLGTVAILGNHDYGHDFRSLDAAKLVANAAAAQGIRTLRNESATIGGLQFIGVEDLWSGQCNAQNALAQSDPDAPSIALCHNPDAVDHPDWASYQGWILAGHTHGGQCKPPFLPPPLIPVQNRRYTSGHIPLAANRDLYINRGLGYLHRIRCNARPEITLFTLAAASTFPKAT